ncbi:MAG: hypothetical protein ACYDB2_05240 [Acidimicrobiales bacterium]
MWALRKLLTPETATQVVNGLIKEIAVSHFIDNWGVKNDKFEADEDSFITHLDEYLKDGFAKLTDSVWEAIQSEADQARQDFYT